MRFSGLLLVLTLPFYFFSCTPQQKLPNYLERMSDTGKKKAYVAPPLRIQKNDLLSIEIHSASLDPQKSDAIFNQVPVGVGAGTATVNTNGYLVDYNGNLEHHRPEIGVIHAEGLTKLELAAEIKKRLTQPVELLKDPTVVIRFLNFKVTVIGEVKNGGVIDVPGERITILQALGLTGDVAQFGLKNNIKVIREMDGTREVGFIDLSSDSTMFNSPYYFLMQNDQVLVEPGKIKQKKEEQQIVQQKMTMAFTLATVVTSITQLFLNRRQ